MTYPLLSHSEEAELQLRLEKIRRAMAEADLEAILIGATPNAFYLTGGIYNGFAYIPIEGEPRFFFIPPCESDSKLVRTVRKPEMISPILAEEGYPVAKTLGLELDELSYSEIERLKKCFPGAVYGNATAVMRKARLTKTPQQIKAMEEDGKKQAAVYARIPSLWHEDMTDIELQVEIERLLRLEGNLGYLRAAGRRMELNMGSLIAGDNADAPSPYDFSMGGAGVDPSLPVGASGMILKPGMAVMIDMNGGFNGYQTDMTRTWSIGRPGELTLRAHNCSVEILHDLEKFALPGMEAGELYRRAVKLAKDADLSEYFMGHRHKVAFIGHGVGIELNEAPVLMDRNKAPLEENMTLAIEPKFVIPGVGAVGIENTYVVTASGLRNITVLDERLNEL